VFSVYHFFFSKIANAKHPAIAIAQPTIFGTGKVSPGMKNTMPQIWLPASEYFPQQ